MRNGYSDMSKDNGQIDLGRYRVEADNHDYVNRLADLSAEDSEKFLDVGIDTSEDARVGTFIQKDRSVIHCRTGQPGVGRENRRIDIIWVPEGATF